MISIKYDGTFEGFLTVVFECYKRKLDPINILGRNGTQQVLFSDTEYIPTDEKKAKRVWSAVIKKLPVANRQLPYRVFLSEIPAIELNLYRFFQRLFDSNSDVETDFGDSNVLDLRKLDRKVSFEAMRMFQFVRFQKTKDNIFFATIEPEYDVIPLIVNHFKERFADQQWLIYDLKRDYGIHYNLNKVEEITLTTKKFHPVSGKVKADILKETEKEFKTLWKDYFQNITIKERTNLKVQRQHMPKRYWKFLPEILGK